MRNLMLLALFVLAGCRATGAISNDARPAAPAAGERTLASDHFRVQWVEPQSSSAEAEAVLERAEKGWAKIVPLLGAARAPNEPLVIRLEGDAARGQVPTVDPATRVLRLYRLQGVGGDYGASLVHELVHAFRWPIWSRAELQTDALVYLEEALAELVATEAGFPSQGFPTYGAPVIVVAGAWLASNEALPIDALIRQHRSLNFRCLAQAYGLRLAFMTWVRARVGLAPLVALANAEAPLTPADLERVFGGSLESQAATWRTETLATFEALPNGKAQALAYRRETPIQYFNVCGLDVVAGSEP